MFPASAPNFPLARALARWLSCSSPAALSLSLSLAGAVAPPVGFTPHLRPQVQDDAVAAPDPLRARDRAPPRVHSARTDRAYAASRSCRLFPSDRIRRRRTKPPPLPFPARLSSAPEPSRAPPLRTAATSPPSAPPPCSNAAIQRRRRHCRAPPRALDLPHPSISPASVESYGFARTRQTRTSTSTRRSMAPTSSLTSSRLHGRRTSLLAVNPYLAPPRH